MRIRQAMNNTNRPTITPQPSPDKNEGQDWQKRAEMLLLILAQKAQTITYDGLASQCGVPSPHRIHKLTNFLETLIAQDITAGAPIRAALVISKVRGRPADGFYVCLEACGYRPDSDQKPDNDQKTETHKRLLAALNPAFQSQSETAPHAPLG